MQIYLLLTELCNLSCPMCIRGRQSGKVMDWDVLQTLDFPNHLASDVVILTGGEPTLYPHLNEVAHFFSARAGKVVLTTNGTTLFDVKQLSDICNLHIQVSLDGDMESHDAVRGKGGFAKTFRFIQKIDSLQLKYSVATVLSRNNASSVANLIEPLSGLRNLAYWKVSYEMPFQTKDFQSLLSAQEWNEMVDGLLSVTPFRLKVQKIFPLELYEKHFGELQALKSNRCLNCGGGKRKIYIYPDFTVYPCTCLTDFPLGNLYSSSMEEILTSSSASSFTHYRVQPGTVCSECKFVELCNGGCIGMSYHYFGKLGRGDIRCPIMAKTR